MDHANNIPYKSPAPPPPAYSTQHTWFSRRVLPETTECLLSTSTIHNHRSCSKRRSCLGRGIRRLWIRTAVEWCSSHCFNHIPVIQPIKQMSIIDDNWGTCSTSTIGWTDAPLSGINIILSIKALWCLNRHPLPWKFISFVFHPVQWKKGYISVLEHLSSARNRLDALLFGHLEGFRDLFDSIHNSPGSSTQNTNRLDVSSFKRSNPRRLMA